MSVIGPCMTWVPILWGQLLGLFNKNKADNVIPHLEAAGNDCLPDHIPAVDNPLPNELPLLDNLHPNHPAVDEPLPDLPYHIITDILSRLPATCVFQCQCVSRPLCILTTTPFFTHTHHNRATSFNVLHSFPRLLSNNFIQLFFWDEHCTKIEANSTKINNCNVPANDPIILFGSYDGFLLFRTRFRSQPLFHIWNPTTEEQATLTSLCSYLYACGFYFHALKKEYEVLFLCLRGAQFKFKILSLGTKSFRDTIGRCSYPPSCERPPVIINGTMYWMVDASMYYRVNRVDPSYSHSIVSFRIETEEFRTMEPGGRIGLSRLDQEQMHLLEMEGQLCLCDPVTSTKLVLWVLNHTTMHWVERHILILPELVLQQRQLGSSAWPNNIITEVVPINKDELLVRYIRRLMIYNLNLGRVKINYLLRDTIRFRGMIHTPSLFSLHSDTGPRISLRHRRPFVTLFSLHSDRRVSFRVVAPNSKQRRKIASK